ncbi:putative AT-hook motif nuclear-localized protein [Dioscorea sansibarensis]
MDHREPSKMNSPEPPGMMVGSNPFATVPTNSMAMPQSSVGMMMPGMRLSFNHIPSNVSKSIDSPGSLFHGDGMQGIRPGMLNMSGEPVKRKRGRPRKYGPDGSMALALSPMPSASTYSNNQQSESTGKRRGRPPGSGKKQQLNALGSAGIAFTPHVITVKSGEDVASKILAFSQQGPRTVCILSANGIVCNVTLRQSSTSGGTVTFEGRFEIISLSGSYLLTDNGGTRSRTGGLSIALAGPDGRVLGGGVAGMLMAAGPVQVVVGSFIAEGKKQKSEGLNIEPSSAPPQVTGFSAPSAASPPSQGTSSESSDDSAGSPIENSGVNCNNSMHPLHNMLYNPMPWPHPHPANQIRHDAERKMMP